MGNQSAEAKKTGRDQAEAGRRVKRRWLVTKITRGFLETKGWDAVHGAKKTNWQLPGETQELNIHTQAPNK